MAPVLPAPVASAPNLAVSRPTARVSTSARPSVASRAAPAQPQALPSQQQQQLQQHGVQAARAERPSTDDTVLSRTSRSEQRELVTWSPPSSQASTSHTQDTAETHVSSAQSPPTESSSIWACSGDVPSTSSASSLCSDYHHEHAQPNSVTVKSETSVKDAAGAIIKVLNRVSSVLVTALRVDASHEALNRAIKALAVSRKYASDQKAGEEVGFLPFNRSNMAGHRDPQLFAFLAFRASLVPGVALDFQPQLELNVSGQSDPHTMAALVVRHVTERGQAVMKAGGQAALFVAMTAAIQARKRLRKQQGLDLMLLPQFITEDTLALLGRQSKFVRLSMVPCGLHGVQPDERSSVIITQPAARQLA